MKASGVISKVDQSTKWCSSMVVVQKKSGKRLKMCGLKYLNENVLWEVHPMPQVDQTLALLAGAKVFSKLDTNSGFWQVPLTEPSRHLTTFITPLGNTVSINSRSRYQVP